MKNIYTLILFLISISLTNAQGYDFGIIYNSDYNFSVVAIPNFDVVDSDVSDIGFSILLPDGDFDATNLTQFNGRNWTLTQVLAVQLTGLGLGDGTRDAFVFTLPPGQTILSHNTGELITLVSFDITNMPSFGLIELLANDDPIAIGLSGAANSFYNSNIDNTTTQDYFLEINPGFASFSFSTLSIVELEGKNDSVTLYPNPTSATLNIKTSLSIDSVIVLDLLGKRQMYFEETETIDVSHLSSGIYMVNITTENGIVVKKMVIK